MIQFGREITGDFDLASSREWLVTNGLGGWASGTVSGANTRRYHGLFVPALQPPLGRTVLLSKLNENARVGDRVLALSSNEYADGTIDPHGYRHIQAFHLDGLIPVWTFALAEALLEKRVWMPCGRNTTLITYTLRRGVRPVSLDILAMVTYRDAHVETRGQGWQPEIHLVPGGVEVKTWDVTFSLIGDGGECVPVREMALGHPAPP
jgi:predicted glycogen debranching enzyme